MKIITMFRVVISFVFCCVLLYPAIIEARLFTTGEVYHSIYTKESITFTSPTKVKISTGNRSVSGSFVFRYGTLSIKSAAGGKRKVKNYSITKSGIINDKGIPFYLKSVLSQMATEALMSQVESNQSDRVEALLINRANPNKKNNYNMRPLSIAAYKGFERVVKLLLDGGADINAQENNDATALILAAGAGHQEIVKLLITRGAEVNTQNSQGNTALILAAEKGYLQVAQQLIRAKANLNTKNSSGYTALYQSLDRAHKKIARLLIKKGADISQSSAELIVAAQKGYLAITKLLLDRGAYMHGKNAFEDTVLFSAIQRNNQEVAKILLQHGADINEKSSKGDSVLATAISYGNYDIAQLLLDMGVDVEGDAGENALKLAIGSNLDDLIVSLHAKGAKLSTSAMAQAQLTGAVARDDIDMVTTLINENKVDINAVDIFGATALRSAVGRGHLEMVKLLLNKGADINASYWGYTILMDANNAGIAKLLIAHGADINVEKGGDTALSEALRNGYVGVVKVLLAGKDPIETSHKLNESLMDNISAISSSTKIQTLIDAGADVNTKSHSGEPALMEAFKRSNYDVVEVLIANGADPNTMGKTGRTALMAAIAHGEDELAKLLLSLGANNSNIKGRFDRGAFLTAARNDAVDILQDLLDEGAPINTIDSDGNTVLMSTLWNSTGEAAELLIARGANLNIQNHSGRTTLMIALLTGKTAIAKLLLDKGVAIDVQDKSASTALMLAIDADNMDIVMLLLSLGADVNVANSNGDTPLLLATAYGQLEIVKLLLGRGAEIDSRNKSGSTPLLAALAGNSDSLSDWTSESYSAMSYDDMIREMFFNAIISNDLRKVRMLIRHKLVNINDGINSSDTGLIVAAAQGKKKIVKLLIAEGAKIDSADELGRTALDWAEASNRAEIAHILIANGAKHSYSPSAVKLWEARFGRTEIAKLLIDQGADTKIKNSDGGTALIIAAQLGDTDIMTRLIKSGVEINAASKHGAIAFLTSLYSGQLDAASLLLESGINVNQENSDGETPLLVAAQLGHADIAQQLLNYGAEINAQSTNVEKTLIFALKENKKKIVAMLRENGAKLSPEKSFSAQLYGAVNKGEQQAVKDILTLQKSAVDVNGKSCGLALIRAVEIGDTAIVKLLINSVTDIDTRRRASSIASDLNLLEIEKILIGAKRR